MELPIPAGSPREEEKEEKEGAGHGREALPQEPGYPLSRSFWEMALDSVVVRLLNQVSPFFRAASFLRSSLSPQTASASSPPMPQAHVRQENDPPNEENPQPNEQPQEDEFVMVNDFPNFTIQVCVTGRTGDCENYFLNEVTERLLKHEIRLKTEDYREDSDHFLLVFCPVASWVGTDMQNALEGLQGEPKAILVMLHHRPKEYDHFLDTKLQAQHPAVVLTVHARYTLEDGLYDCQMNKEAVAAVAEVLKVHFKVEQEKPPTPDHLKEEPEKPPTPDHLKEEQEKSPTPDSGDQMCSNSLQESND